MIASLHASTNGAEYFDMSEEIERIVPAPVRLRRADAVRSKLADLGVTDEDLAEAVAWARDKATLTR
jgi:heme oxygenase